MVGRDGPHADLTERIIGAAIAVHRALGPGLLESVYQACFSAELRALGIAHQRELPVPIVYRGERIETAFRLDFIVEDIVVVETKAIEKLLPVHEAQLLSHMRLLNKQVGLLINFNVPVLKDGIRRRILSIAF